jgi:hypothetical protein
VRGIGAQRPPLGGLQVLGGERDEEEEEEREMRKRRRRREEVRRGVSEGDVRRTRSRWIVVSYVPPSQG